MFRPSILPSQLLIISLTLVAITGYAAPDNDPSPFPIQSSTEQPVNPFVSDPAKSMSYGTQQLLPRNSISGWITAKLAAMARNIWWVTTWPAVR